MVQNGYDDHFGQNDPIPNWIFYAAPIGAFCCPEIRAFTGLGQDSSTVSKVPSDHKVLFKHKNGR